MIQTLFPNNKDNAGTVQWWSGEREGELKFFPDQHNHRTWISLKHSVQFWRLEWGADSHLQHLYSNLVMFFKKNGLKFF
jgi:hypothetical protein